MSGILEAAFPVLDHLSPDGCDLRIDQRDQRHVFVIIVFVVVTILGVIAGARGDPGHEQANALVNLRRR